MKNIAVIGSGTMGNGIAHVFAQYGYKVSLIDISEEALKKAVATIDKNLGRQIIANFSALLAEADYFRVDGYDARLQIHHGFADRRVGKKRLQKNSDDRGIANRLLRHTRAERTQENPRGFILCARFIGSGT